MGSLLVDQIKKQASSFLQEKYKTARLTFTDVTEAELLAEEVTTNDPCSPDARTMTRIAEASFEIDDYWRIVDVLHRRLYSIDWKRWRQSYKSLVLLEFLLTHGPEDFAAQFQRETYVIQELGTFNHTDEKGFNWGVNMKKKSDEILRLLGGGEKLKEARLKALRVTKEIQGFGGSMTSSPSSSTPSSSSSEASTFSSFLSCSTTSTPTWNDHINELNKFQLPSPAKESPGSYSQGGFIHGKESNTTFPTKNKNVEGSVHLWDCPEIQETGSLLDSQDVEDGKISGICSKLVGSSSSRDYNDEKVGFRSVSDAGRMTKKKFDRQYSLWY